MNRYRIEFTNSAAKEFRALASEIKRRITSAIDELCENPYPMGVSKLKGYATLYRIRVGDYRVIYEVDMSNQSIRIVRIRHRREAYR